MSENDRFIILLLSGFIVFFSVLTLIVAFMLKEDGQTFQIFASTGLGTFIGSLTTYLKMKAPTSPEDSKNTISGGGANGKS